MSYEKEPKYSHGATKKTGVLLVNLGTPELPTSSAVKKYLAQFLSDKRVVEIPRIIWFLILHLIILRFRPKKSAEKYRSIWTDSGSPLRFNTENQADSLRRSITNRIRSPLVIDYAMRYGTPSIDSAILKQKKENVVNILVVPLFPQYCSSTTGSVFDAVADTYKRLRNMPGLRFIRNFHDNPGYIMASANLIKNFWKNRGLPSRLILSFHGVPEFSLREGDPYHCECHKTGRLITEKLGISQDNVIVSFQSRFGRAEWLKPYTIGIMKNLGQAKTERVDVFCPGFVSDCLETLEEIAMENRDVFLTAGGKEFNYIPCLNDSTSWLSALEELVIDNLEGWVTENHDQLAEVENKKKSRTLAIEMGAKD